MVPLCYAPADGQSQSRALSFRFRGIEGFQNFGQDLSRYAHARIGNFNADLFFFRTLGYADRQCSSLSHGIACICEQIQKQLSQLLTICMDKRSFGFEFPCNRNIVLA